MVTLRARCCHRWRSEFWRPIASLELNGTVIAKTKSSISFFIDRYSRKELVRPILRGTRFRECKTVVVQFTYISTSQQPLVGRPRIQPELNRDTLQRRQAVARVSAHLQLRTVQRTCL